MVAIKQQELSGLTGRRLRSYAGIVIHGADMTMVQNMSRDVAKAFVPAGGVTPHVVRLNGSSVQKDPGLLASEVFALSLLDGETIIEVSECGEDLLTQLKVILANTAKGNFFILLAGGLSKSSKLRSFAETNERLICAALYEEDVNQVWSRLAQSLDDRGMTLSAEGRSRFFELVGGDYKSAPAELEKLMLYALGQTEISIDDVEAICGDTSNFGIDQIIDSIMSGDYDQADIGFSHLDATALGGFLPQFTGHLNRLINLRLEMSKGASADVAFRTAKPPLFFGRRNQFLTQLKIWDLPALMKAAAAIATATEQSRRYAQLDQAIVGRCILSLARNASAGQPKSTH